MTQISRSGQFELKRLANGAFSVHSVADGETFHPVVGTVTEADALYVRQLGLIERVTKAEGEFVIWDVGLGAGGNVLTAIRRLANTTAAIRILSCDRTLEPLRFARENAAALEFPLGFESHLDQLLAQGQTQFVLGGLKVAWQIVLGDFPMLSQSAAWPAPGAIFFDAYSPKRNPDMWTLPVFTNVFARICLETPCALATYTRSTMARVHMLLAGLFVGAGRGVAEKEETTIAANRLELIRHPLDRRWLERVKVSGSAEPLRESAYRQQPLSENTREQLWAHPQFR